VRKQTVSDPAGTEYTWKASFRGVENEETVTYVDARSVKCLKRRGYVIKFWKLKADFLPAF